MKRFILAIVAFFAVMTVSAEFRWGPTVGVNISKYDFKQDLIEIDQSVGYGGGIMGELMFPGIGFGIDFGLQYTMHGAKLHLGDKKVWQADGYGVEQSYLHTIQIPIDLRFKYTNLNGIEHKIAPFVYGGPIFSFTAGHNKLDALDYSGGCIMLQCGLGAELFKHFQVSGGYYWGMTYDFKTVKLDNFSAKSRGWNVKLTYLF